MSSQSSTLQIIAIVLFTFIGFLCVGLPLAVLPGYVHNDLGYDSMIAGLIIGLQYFATLASRPMTGSLCDRLGPKRAVIYGLIGCTLSGVLTLLSTSLQETPWLSLSLLIAARLTLGVAQGLVGTGSISWAIGQVGAENTAQVISWNGIAAYGAIAIGAPLGVLMVAHLGLWSLGTLLILLGVGALLAARNKPAAPINQGIRLPFSRVFMRVLPNGVALGLGSIGYGTLATFITLYYASRGWEGAAYALTAFGFAFIGARLLFAGAIKSRGGYRVAIACLTLESIGLLMLWLAPQPVLTLCGAALTGFGLSLVYPALGVEVISRIPAASRSSALGAYAIFFDLALGIAGPLMGAIANGFGFAAIFLASAILSAIALVISITLMRNVGKPA
ncbi:MFS transporter [Pseudomonas sp. LRF_L74]|uniref:MFS transporter n=1 Tax=Pseudomonas sp. LRF_L74 TaxID=3369422 RepID=UPI003F63CEDA